MSAEPGAKQAEVTLIRPAGLRALIPGHAQWFWGQKERGFVHFGSFAAALSVGVFIWGTRLGLVILAFAFFAHAASAADAIRQGSFPGFGRWIPPVSASIGLGLGCYLPMLGVASALAWPGASVTGGSEGYLINRWAYQGSVEPKVGDSVWIFPYRAQAAEIATVLAGPGQEVEWDGDECRIDGKVVKIPRPNNAASEADATIQVPVDHVLVRRGNEEAPFDTTSGLALVPKQRIVGRAWAQYSPFWNRRLLP
jgi:hypothetical protein